MKKYSSDCSKRGDAHKSLEKSGNSWIFSWATVKTQSSSCCTGLFAASAFYSNDLLYF